MKLIFCLTFFASMNTVQNSTLNYDIFSQTVGKHALMEYVYEAPQNEERNSSEDASLSNQETSLKRNENSTEFDPYADFFVLKNIKKWHNWYYDNKDNEQCTNAIESLQKIEKV